MIIPTHSVVKMTTTLINLCTACHYVFKKSTSGRQQQDFLSEAAKIFVQKLTLNQFKNIFLDTTTLKYKLTFWYSSFFFFFFSFLNFYFLTGGRGVDTLIHFLPPPMLPQPIKRHTSRGEMLNCTNVPNTKIVNSFYFLYLTSSSEMSNIQTHFMQNWKITLKTLKFAQVERNDLLITTVIIVIPGNMSSMSERLSLY